jgi:hypothetical protein
MGFRPRDEAMSEKVKPGYNREVKEAEKMLEVLAQ